MNKTSALVLGLSIVLASFIASSTVLKLKTADSSITVKGYSQQDVTSDIAKWRVSFSRSSVSLAGAYEAIEKDKLKVKSFLVAQGIKSQEIEVLPTQSTAQYRRTSNGSYTNQIESYLLTQTFRITSTNVENVLLVSRQISQLLKEGLGISSHSPQFFYSGLEGLKISLLKSAVENAKERASVFIDAVGPLKKARQGVFQITAPNSTDVSDYGTYDTTSVEKTVKAVITAEYYVGS